MHRTKNAGVPPFLVETQRLRRQSTAPRALLVSFPSPSSIHPQSKQQPRSGTKPARNVASKHLETTSDTSTLADGWLPPPTPSSKPPGPKGGAAVSPPVRGPSIITPKMDLESADPFRGHQASENLFLPLLLSSPWGGKFHTPPRPPSY